MGGHDAVAGPFNEKRPMISDAPPPPPGGVQMTCPLCASAEVEYLRRLRRLTYRMTSAWFRCLRCGHLFAQPRTVPLGGNKE
jgi:DNA-directed RNA polymerase subunit M/transcription elongation factor TFIIS